MKFFRTKRTDFYLHEIKTMLDKEMFELNYEYQRSNEWTIIQKSRYIESMILDIASPIIHIAENTSDGTLTVIDGLQRLKTIQQFLNNEFQLTELEFIGDLFGNKYYEDIKVKRKINGRFITACIIYDVNQIEESSLYRRFNQIT